MVGECIRKIAPAAAGNADLLADNAVPLQYGHRPSTLSRNRRAEESGRTASKHYHIYVNLFCQESAQKSVLSTEKAVREQGKHSVLSSEKDGPYHTFRKSNYNSIIPLFHHSNRINSLLFPRSK